MGRILVFTGARQTGKTTLVKQFFHNYAYLAIDDPVESRAYLSLTASQWKELYPRAVLDEVQKKPVLIESIKSVYDRYKEPRYVLLGSSQLLLLEKVRESLAGRCTIVELFPLTLPERCTNKWKDMVQPSFFQQYMKGKRKVADVLPSFVLAKNYARAMKEFDEYLKFGSYPAISQSDMTENDRYEWLSTYVKTYLERDIRDLAMFRELEPFIKLQRFLAGQTACILNFASLARDAGVSVPTAQRYMQYLDISYQAILLHPWFGNQQKRLVKSPKVHFLDTGVLHAVLQKRGGLTGNEFESAVVSEIYKQAKNQRLPVTFYHLRTLDGREVDLLLETADDFVAIEIKSTGNADKTDAKHLIGLQDILNKPLRHSFVLSNDQTAKTLADGVTAMHAAAFLS